MKVPKRFIKKDKSKNLFSDILQSLTKKMQAFLANMLGKDEMKPSNLTLSRVTSF